MLRGIIKGPSPNPALNTSSKGQSNLKNGDILKGTVTGKTEAGDFLVSVRGRQIRAFSSVPLVKGGKYLFRVSMNEKRTELRIIGGNSGIQMISSGKSASGSMISARLDKILEQLVKMEMPSGLSTEAAALLKKLKTFPGSGFHNDYSSNVSWITRNIQGSGIFWENKLLQYLMGKKDILLNRLIDSDLKGLLLSLKGDIGSKKSDNEDLNAIITRLKEAVELIESEQLLNLMSLRDGYGWLIHLAGLRDEGFESADLYIRKKSDQKGISFSLFLELTELGKMEWNVSLTGSRMDIRIFVKSEKISKYITDQLPELEKNVKKTGLLNGKIVCEVKDLTGDFGPPETDRFSSMHVII